MPQRSLFKTKTFSAALLGIFCFSQLSPAFAATVQPDTEERSVQNKGILDGIQRVLRGERICIGPVCINSGDLTEDLLRDQIREFAEDNAPITVSTDQAYPLTETLPGGAFQPRMLDLQAVSPNSVLPVGDYVIPVQVFCLQRRAASPDGHRYVLGQYGGAQREILADLNRAAASSSIPHSEIQGISWAVQAGVSYDEMPSDMQQIFNQLIPQHRSQLNGDFWDKIEAIWNTASRYVDLPSFESFLISELGETGETLVAFRHFRDRIVSRGEDWRNLSDSFIIDSSSQGESGSNILETPWSNVSNGVYARFITSGNADDIGLLELRVTDSRASHNTTREQFVSTSNKQNDTQNTNESDTAPPPPEQNNEDDEIPSGQPPDVWNVNDWTVNDTTDLISGMVAVPEGGDAVQPLAMAPASDESWLSSYWDSVVDLVDYLAEYAPEWENVRPYLSGASLAAICAALPAAASSTLGSLSGAGVTAGATGGGLAAGAAGSAPPLALGAIALITGCGLYGYYAGQPVLSENANGTGGGNNDGSAEDSSVPEIPPIPNDPTQSPGEGWEWRGRGEVGSKEGSWYNPGTGESLHPDLDHPPPIGPHWDYKDPTGGEWRVFPDGRIEPK